MARHPYLQLKITLLTINQLVEILKPQNRSKQEKAHGAVSDPGSLLQSLLRNNRYGQHLLLPRPIKLRFQLHIY